MLLISGTILKKVRSDLGMTQPQFAKWLSQQSGEHLDAKKISRMENYGKKKACHPLAPSPLVVDVISSIFPHLLPTKGFKPMTQDQKEMLQEVVKLYKDLGILENPSETAAEMIEAVESDIRRLENKLVGDTSDMEDIEKQLQEIKADKAEIRSQLQEIDTQLAKIDPELLKEYAPELFDAIKAVEA